MEIMVLPIVVLADPTADIFYFPQLRTKLGNTVLPA